MPVITLADVLPVICVAYLHISYVNLDQGFVRLNAGKRGYAVILVPGYICNRSATGKFAEGRSASPAFFNDHYFSIL